MSAKANVNERTLISSDVHHGLLTVITQPWQLVIQHCLQTHDSSLTDECDSKLSTKSIQYPNHRSHHSVPLKRTINHPWQLKPKGHDDTLKHIQSIWASGWSLWLGK